MQRPNLSGFQVVLSYSGGVKVWDTGEKQTALPSGTSWTLDAGGAGFPSLVYAEGIATGPATLTMSLKNSENVQIHQDSVRVTVVNVDIDVDSDNSGMIDGTKDEDEVEEAVPGKIVPPQ